MGVSRTQVRYALEQTNQQFVEFLRAEIASQVDSGANVDCRISCHLKVTVFTVAVGAWKFHDCELSPTPSYSADFAPNLN